MVRAISSWFEEHQAVAVSIAAASALLAIGMALAVPWIIGAMPRDLFVAEERQAPWWARHHPVLRWVVAVARNALGGVLVIAGIGMLVLPGQGILTIAVGVALLQFPGKARLGRWLVRRRGVMRALNWLRRRMGREPFLTGPDHPDA